MGKIKMLCALLLTVAYSGYTMAGNDDIGKEANMPIALQAVPVKQEKTFYVDDGTGHVYVITITRKSQNEISQEEHDKTHGNIPLHSLFMEMENQYTF